MISKTVTVRLVVEKTLHVVALNASNQDDAVKAALAKESNKLGSVGWSVEEIEGLDFEEDVDDEKEDPKSDAEDEEDKDDDAAPGSDDDDGEAEDEETEEGDEPDDEDDKPLDDDSPEAIRRRRQNRGRTPKVEEPAPAVSGKPVKLKDSVAEDDDGSDDGDDEDDEDEDDKEDEEDDDDEGEGGGRRKK